MRLTVANYRDEFRARAGRHSAANKAPRRRVMASILISQRAHREPADQRQERSSRRSVGITAAILIRASRRADRTLTFLRAGETISEKRQPLRKQPGFISVSHGGCLFPRHIQRNQLCIRSTITTRIADASERRKDSEGEREREREKDKDDPTSPVRRSGGCR